MSVNSISIVPRISNFRDKNNKAAEILQWLMARDIIKPERSNCVLGPDDLGYAISDGARFISMDPEYLPFERNLNGLEINFTRSVYDAGLAEEIICPACRQNIVSEDWDFINEWASEISDNITCPLCHTGSEIHLYKFSPEWGFSDLGFIFWEWQGFTREFLNGFRQRLGCDINVVYNHL